MYAIRSYYDLICGSEYCARAWDMSEKDISLIAGPIGHDLSFSKGFLGSVLTGGTTVFLDSVDLDDICRTIEKEKVTTVVWVPTLASRITSYNVCYTKLLRFDLRVPGAQQTEIRTGGIDETGLVHDILMRDVRIRKDDLFNIMFPDQRG